MGSRGGGGLRDNVELLSVWQECWCMGYVGIPGWMEYESNLGNNIS